MHPDYLSGWPDHSATTENRRTVGQRTFSIPIPPEAVLLLMQARHEAAAYDWEVQRAHYLAIVGRLCGRPRDGR